MIIQYFIYLCLYLVYTIVGLIIGKLFCKLLFTPDKFTLFQNIFLNILIGDTIIITIYSPIKCHLKTINILIVFLFVITIIINKIIVRKKNIHQNTLLSFNTSQFSKEIITTVLISIIPFVIRLIVYYNNAYHLPNIPHFDHQYYISIAETIKQSGIENFFSAKTLLFDQYKLPTPYRYHDIWLTALFLEFNLSSIAVYHLIVSSFTILLSLLGLLSLYDLYKKNSFLSVVFTSLFLFVGFAYFHVGNIFVDTQNPIEYQKLGISYALLSAAIIFFQRRMPGNAILAVCILFVYSVAALPLIIGIGVLICSSFIFFKGYSKLETILYISPLFISFVGFFVFYKYFGFQDLGVSFSWPGIKLLAFAIKGLTVKSFARFWIIYVWIILVLVFNKKIIKNLLSEYTIIKISLLLVVFCIFFQGLMVNYSDPNQFATNNTIPLLHIILYMVVVVFILNLKIDRLISKVLFSLLILIICTSAYLTYTKGQFYNARSIKKYSISFIQDVDFETKHIKNRIGVYWVDSSYYVNSNRMKEFFIRPGEYLKVMGNNFDVVNLSADVIPDSNDKTAKNIKDQSALIIYKKQQENALLNNIDLKLKFIRQYKFEYLVLGKNVVLPTAIEQVISKKIYDSKSGETFCLLKNN